MPGGYDWTSLSTAILLVPIAYASTNIDNLLIMAALAGGRASRAAIVTGFILASLVVLIVSALAIVIETLVPPVILGYLGFVPISIGLYLLLAPTTGDDEPAITAASWPAITGLLVANSSDTVFALGPLFAESQTSARIGLAAATNRSRNSGRSNAEASSVTVSRRSGSRRMLRSSLAAFSPFHRS